VLTNPACFGTNYKQVTGQSGGGTQPKVEFTTEDNCTEIYIYLARNNSYGKIDINVTNTSGVVNETRDMYSAEWVSQDILAIKGLDAETHDVTLTSRSDKSASSSNYYFLFSGYVAVIEDATDYDADTITYKFTPNDGTNWYTLTEGLNDIDYIQTLTGHTSEDEFQADEDVWIPSDADEKAAWLVVEEETTPSNWVELTYGTDYSIDDSTGSSNRPTVTLTTATSNDIRISWRRYFDVCKMKAELTVGDAVRTKTYINDFGINSVK